MGDDLTDMERVGLFEDGPYDTDPVEPIKLTRDEDDPEGDLLLGGPWLPPGPAKIKDGTNDWPFSQFLSLWEDAEYEDPGTWRKNYEQEQADKNISDQPFLTAVGEKTMNGLGTYYGTFYPEPLEAFDPEVKDEEKDEDLQGVPNFLNNPGKKGSGYGYNDICFTPYPEALDEDPYFDQLEIRREMREDWEDKVLGTDPFIAGAAPKQYFDENPWFDSRDPDGEEETYDFDRNAKEEDDFLEGPFIPSSFTKKTNGNKDVNVPFERWPSYDPSDPWEPVPVNIFRQLEELDEDKPPWKPTFPTRTRQVRSVINHNINLRINARNFNCF